MKFLIPVIALVLPLTSYSSTCDNVRLLWDNDQITRRYECLGDTAKLCLTEAIWARNNESYMILSGSADVDYGDVRESFNSLVRVKNDKEGKVSETSKVLKISHTPSAAIIIDNYKYHTEFELNKKTSKATISKKMKKTFSLSRWQTRFSADLDCREI